jgi:hypothetical protein
LDSLLAGSCHSHIGPGKFHFAIKVDSQVGIDPGSNPDSIGIPRSQMPITFTIEEAMQTVTALLCWFPVGCFYSTRPRPLEAAI